MLRQLDLLSTENPDEEKGYDRDDSYTHSAIIDAARASLGGRIHWDLATSRLANKSVQAANFFTESYSFLEHHNEGNWPPNFWCNPPWSNGNLEKFARIIVGEKKLKGFFLGPSDSSTEWYRLLHERSRYLIQPIGRKYSYFYQPGTGQTICVSRGLAIFGFGNVDPYPWADFCNIAKPTNYEVLRWKRTEESIEVA